MLIGTHRVLSRDVIPKELGLVIVDEEQRFGVAQKELLRSLRLEVDVLALTATPIPRTLHMSLSGLRDISVIETPPEGRRPIRTHVGEYDEELIKTALEREVARGGQAFYLHNRVETIDEAADRLRQLAPGLRYIVGHGQMKERELEEHMLSFLRGDADVLVSTTIIESGLDIPQANTLVVERADALGLAQLYQIRGRVGRSDLLAHSYLFYPDASELTPEARARLATLADHTELGAGFAIAMRDLEIRGAGELLGAEQHGHLAALGFELYVELLGEAVAELAGERRIAPRPVRVDARIDAYVPAEYIPAEAQKIDLHRRLALTETEDELAELEAANDRPLRAVARARREPVRDPGREAEARAPRRRLPRLPGRPLDGRPASSWAPRSCGLYGPVSTPRSMRAPEMKFRLSTKSSRKRSSWSMLYSKRAGQRKQIRCKRRSFHDKAPFFSALRRRPRGRVRSRPPAAAARKSVGANEVAVVGDLFDLEGAVRPPSRPGEEELQGAEAAVPEVGTEQYAALRKQAMQFLVQRCEFNQKADELDVEVTDADVEKQLRRSRRSTSARTASATRPARRSTGRRSRSRA